MFALLLALRVVVPFVVLEPAPAQTLPRIGRIYTSATTHLGVRAHLYVDGQEIAGAVTFQVTTTRLP